MPNRDDFTRETKELLGRRTGYLCSNPACQAFTVGPQSSGRGTINLGVAAHICAAAPGPGAKRYDREMTRDQRKSPDNGIWLCQNCAKHIDSDEGTYTVEKLHAWKQEAEQHAVARLGNKYSAGRVDLVTSMQAVSQSPTPQSDLPAILQTVKTAAVDDIKAFRDFARVPTSAKAPRLRSNADDGSSHLTLEATATAIARTTGALLLAPPGTGKSTTLILLAEHIHARSDSVCVMVPLPEWAATHERLFEVIRQRDRFGTCPLEYFAVLARLGKLVLMLDGWNEISADDRSRLDRTLSQLRRDFPQLIVVMASRPGTGHPPFPSHLSIAPLTGDHQVAIARDIAGDVGVLKLQAAKAVPGLSELVAIPLYLTAIIKSGGAVPASKEQVIDGFMQQQVMSPAPNEVSTALRGLQLEYLKELGYAMQRADTTILPEAEAREIIHHAVLRQIERKQLINEIEPADVLRLLSERHILVRTSDGTAIQFHHQQFQEWHASFAVENLVRKSHAHDDEATLHLRTAVLNFPSWDEVVLFAAERLSRTHPEVTATLIHQALSIAPLLAAEVIAHCSDAVWALVKDDAKALVDRWSAGKLKRRALAFMLATGMPDFSERTWPLLSSPDSSTQLNALRASPILRLTSLGSNIRVRVNSLPVKTRENLLAELVINGDADARALAIDVASSESELSVRYHILHACYYSGSISGVLELMRGARDDFWQYVAQRGDLLDISDNAIRERLLGLAKGLAAAETNLDKKLQMLFALYPDHCDGAAIGEVLEHPDYPIDSDAIQYFIGQSPRFANLVRSALLTRARNGYSLPYYATSVIAGIVLHNDPELEQLVIETRTEDKRASVAATVLGAESITHVIEAYLQQSVDLLAVPDHLRAEQGSAVRKLEDRLIETDFDAFTEALKSFRNETTIDRIDALAQLIERHGDLTHTRELLAGSEESLAALAESLKILTATVLAAGTATRIQLARMARALGRTGSPDLAMEVFALLDADLVRRDLLLSQAPPRQAPHERHPDLVIDHRGHYRSAFVAIGTDEVKVRLQDYLGNLYFGQHAAYALQSIEGVPSARVRRRLRGDLPALDSAIENRKRRLAGSALAAIPSAEAMSRVIDDYAGSGDADKQHHALQLASIMMTLPHRDVPDLPAKIRREKNLDTRVKALASMAISGHVVDADLLAEGLVHLFEASLDRRTSWFLEPQYEKIIPWLELYPFSNRPEDLVPQVRACGKAIPPTYQLVRAAISLGIVGGNASFDSLLQLATIDEDLWDEPDWQEALIACDAAAGLRTLITKHLTPSAGASRRAPRLEWQIDQLVKNTALSQPVAKDVLLELYRVQTRHDALVMIESGLCELGEADVLIEIVKRRTALKMDGGPNMWQALRRTVLNHKAVGRNTYELSGRESTELRRELFALMQAGSEVAHSCLLQIDQLRDEYGSVGNEPRHPNSLSAEPWPLP